MSTVNEETFFAVAFSFRAGCLNHGQSVELHLPFQQQVGDELQQEDHLENGDE
jgi:hypothetical protein